MSSNNSGDESKTITLATASPSHSATPTLLPSSVARAVSFVTRSSSLYLRLGTFVGGLALDGARVTTLTGLEVSRAVLEAILSRAGQDVADHSTGDLGREEAEGLIERSLATLHRSMTGVSFAISAGFHLSSATLASASGFSQILLTALDSVLGSTDSSRAIASIITLIQHEFQNPATGVEGEKVGVMDLLVGICGLALLQRWCSRLTDAEEKENGYSELVWDIVILDDGRKADVVAAVKDHTRSIEAAHGANMAQHSTRSRPESFVTAFGDEEILQAIQRQQDRVETSSDWPEAVLRERLMEQLPPEATVSITTATTTKKTITVEISGVDPVGVSAPPGLELVEEGPAERIRRNSFELRLSGEQDNSLTPSYRLVYQSVQDSFHGTTFKADEPSRDTDASMTEPGITSVAENDTTQVKALPDLPSPTFTNSGPPSPDESMDLAIKPRSKTQETLTTSMRAPLSTRTNSANLKKHPKPASSTSPSGGESQIPKPAPTKKLKTAPKKPVERTNSSDKKTTTLKNVIKKGAGSSFSNILGKETISKSQVKAPREPVQSPPTRRTGASSPIAPRVSQIIPRAPQRGTANYFSSRDLGTKEFETRSPSRGSLYSMHDHRRDSIVSHTETIFVQSPDSARPVSPTIYRGHLRNHSNLLRTRSEKNVTTIQSSPRHNHRRAKSYVPSIYTLNTNNSANSLILAPRNTSSYFDRDALSRLSRTGQIQGIFPNKHIVRNISRFVRFSSASYGSNFMRLMGLSSSGHEQIDPDPDHHYEHHSFSHHTQLPPDTILLSSFVDPQGGTDSSGQTNTGIPMVHFVSLDHESKAVVLTCRGTLGFEDVLTDMTCDYDDLVLRGRAYKVHKGIHASARRLLNGGGGRVMATIKAALEEFPNYGLVLCGHSLGGGVTALLAVMISQPADDGTSFRTASVQPLLLGSGEEEATTPSITLPPGRPIHVYAYGPPATMSPSLRSATQGLITTIVNGQDVVPYLSLGTLHDAQAVALAFKTDDSGAKGEVKNRLWSGLTSGFTDQWYGRPAAQSEDDQWAYASLKTLRASMLSAKLLPPGEVFLVETQPVLQRQAFTTDTLGRPARRVVLKYIRKVEERFGELRFGGSMLLDHSPGRYEASLAALSNGVLE